MTGSKILVVDDEPTIRSFLLRLLEREGYLVQAAADGLSALQRLDAERYDLILTDIKMDLLDGVALLQEARQRQGDLAVILLTGHATVDTAVAALRQGASNYLLKPAKNEDILAAVAEALEKRADQQRHARLEQIAGQMAEVLQNTVPYNPLSTASESAHIQYKGLELDAISYTATLSSAPLDLTPTEFRLLLKLGSAPGVTFDYVSLVQAACGYACTRQEAQEIIGTHIRNLRQKLGVESHEAVYLEAVRGIGYRLNPGQE